MEKGCRGKTHMVIYLLPDFYKTIFFMRPWKVSSLKIVWKNVKYGQVHGDCSKNVPQTFCFNNLNFKK